ncbi:hypothetical protein [Natrinema sp. 1APR25-10V2]|uniref:hypothetical protein n=1 Tax=Natrinema sp. 1APR25-10V2 TaxID=2951081 RepID=UPI002874ABE6|nr:hypothetical protein [Natrinema sp. 1APR25-10V2]MDS0474835.1 hypothetical protein [Natrinema sp. 1APR25-10V2]
MPSERSLTNLITIVGRGVPANYEISVDGTIEMVAADPDEEAVIISEQTAEGAIETGVDRFQFSGEMANAHVVDWNGAPSPESPSTPEVNIDYGVPARSADS